MNDALVLILSWIAGAGLGAVFFGGLWWTLRRGLLSQRPALWFVVSLLLRTGVVLSGFAFVSGGHWQRLLACLLGFVTARLAVRWRTRPSAASLPLAAPEVRHAP